MQLIDDENEAGDDFDDAPSASTPHQSAKRRKKDDSEVDKSLITLQSYLKTKMESTSKSQQPDDDSVFGQFVVAELKKIKNEKSKRNAKKQIIDIIFDTQEKQDAAEEIHYYVMPEPNMSLSYLQ